MTNSDTVTLPSKKHKQNEMAQIVRTLVALLKVQSGRQTHEAAVFFLRKRLNKRRKFHKATAIVHTRVMYNMPMVPTLRFIGRPSLGLHQNLTSQTGLGSELSFSQEADDYPIFSMCQEGQLNTVPVLCTVCGYE